MRIPTNNNTLLLQLLLLSTLLTVSQCRTWRRPTTLLPPHAKNIRQPFVVVPPLMIILRGGDDNDGVVPYVPQVPESTAAATTNVQARGGSTTTTQSSSSSSTSTTSTTTKTSTTSSTPITSFSVSPTNSVHSSKKGGTTTTTTTTTSPTISSIVASKQTKSGGAAATTTTTTANNSAASTTTSKRGAISKNKRNKDGSEPADHPTHKKIAKKLRNRNARNLRRKVMHASFGFFFAALNHFIPKAKFVPGMTILTSATLLMELLRYRKGFHWMNDILHLVLGKSLRKHEMDGKFTGSFYYFLGVTVTAALYPTSCATLGICQLAIADPTASFFGRATRHVYWSRIENGLGGLGRNKGLLGFIGGALACVPMNYRLLSKAQFAVLPTNQALWTASLALGFAGAFADLAVPTPTLTLPKKVLGVRVPPFHIDDNFVVPVFSGMACQYVFRYCNFPADLALAKFLVW